MVKKRIPRLRYLIEPKWQLTFTFLLVIVGLVSAGACGFLAYRLIFSNQLLVVKHGIHLAPEYLTLMVDQRRDVVRLWSIAFCVTAGVLFIAGIFLSHKMVGPLFAFRRAMTRLVEGDFSTPLRLRKRDEFQELKEAYNGMLEKLQGQTMEDISVLDKIREDLQKLMREEEISETREKVRKFLLEVTELANEKRNQLRKEEAG